MNQLRSKIYGGVYGQALGDAFGMPALLSPAQTRARFGRITDFVAAPDDHPVHAGLPAGRVTDDTEQAIWLARQIIADGGVTLEGSARAILGWYDAIGGDSCVFVGPSTRRGVAKIRAGVDLRQTGLGGDTNGSAMRASVVGLIHPGDVEGAARDAALTAIPTHNTHVACAAAAAVAGAVACALEPDVGLVRPRSMWMRVVFPAPLGPSTPRISPFLSSKETWSTARNFLKSLVRFSTSTTGSTMGNKIAEVSTEGNSSGFDRHRAA